MAGYGSVGPGDPRIPPPYQPGPQQWAPPQGQAYYPPQQPYPQQPYPPQQQWAPPGQQPPPKKGSGTGAFIGLAVLLLIVIGGLVQAFDGDDDDSGGGSSNVDFTMPSVVGMDLQDAQDTMQDNDVFLSTSTDLLGTRQQVVDSNWVVCTQSIPAGQQVTGNVEGQIDFGVVQRGEPCP